jgi:hypothetical protein
MTTAVELSSQVKVMEYAKNCLDNLHAGLAGW